MSQIEILKKIASNPGILQSHIWGNIHQDSIALQSILRKKYATRTLAKAIPGRPGARSYKWYITSDGLDAIKDGQTVINVV